MKRVWNRLAIMIGAITLVIAGSMANVLAQGSVSLQVFYDELHPYGTWIDHGQYGYVWMPRVGPDFVPYATNGYWIQTEYGNTWVSDYSWGWAPFHYGRWFYDDFYGWIWVPDTTWGPAWVAWRSGGGYYGWAPLMPGIGVHLSFHYYDRIPHRYWSFVPYHYITYRHVYRHCVARPQVVNIINHTTIITHNHIDHHRNIYFTGPDRREIERHRGGRVEVHSISDRDRPGRTEVSQRTANFYRPNIDDSRESSRSTPATYVRKDRGGKLETIDARRERTDAFPADKRREPANNWRSEGQRNNGFESLDERRNNPTQREYRSPREIQGRTYEPRERQPSIERTGPSRTYEQIQRQRENNARDRYEAPPIQRAPAQRERQQRTYQPQQQRTDRQSTMRQRENIMMQRESSPSLRENSSRGQQRQSSRSMEFRKRN